MPPGIQGRFPHEGSEVDHGRPVRCKERSRIVRVTQTEQHQATPHGRRLVFLLGWVFVHVRFGTGLTANSISHNLRRSAFWFPKFQPLTFGGPQRQNRALRIRHLAVVVTEVRFVQILLYVASADVMVRAIDAAFVRGNVTPILTARVFPVLVRDEIMIGKLVVHEVVNRGFIGLNVGADLDVLFHDRLYIIHVDALDVESEYQTAQRENREPDGVGFPRADLFRDLPPTAATSRET